MKDRKSRKGMNTKKGDPSMKQMVIKLDLEKSTFEDYTTWEIESVLKRFCRDLKKEDMIENWIGLGFLRDSQGNIVGEVRTEYSKEEEDEI